MNENELGTSFEASPLLNSRINLSSFYRMVRAFSSGVYPNMFGENFQIYSVQITEKCICQTPLSR